MRMSIVAIMVWVLTVVGDGAQQTRDGATAATGTGVLTGVVTTAGDSPVPIPRAVMSLSGGALRTSVLAVTDHEGRFVFRQVPDGRFTLDARKAGFIREVYGAVAVGSTAGVSIAINGGTTEVAMSLVRSAAISGRIVMPAGAPVSSIRLQVLRWETGRGGRQLVSARGGAYGVAGDGRYRIGGLPPDDYVLVAYPFGRVERRLFDQDAPGPVVSLAPVYSPGVVDPTQATLVRVEAGRDRVVDISMDLVPTARVEGRVFGPDGTPLAGAQVSAEHGLPVVPPLAPVRTAADGSFVLSAIVPGTYTVVARGASTLWAQSPLTLTPASRVEGLHLTLQPGRTIRGKFMSAADGSAAVKASSLVVGLVPDDDRTTTVGMPVVAPASHETFEIPGAGPGRYRLQVTVPEVLRSSLFVIGMTADGRDVLDDAIVVGLERDVEVAIALTTNPSVLNVTVRNDDGRAVAGRPVIVIPGEPALRVPWSRRVVFARAGVDGIASFQALPDGAYLVADAGDIPAPSARTPEWFAQVASLGTAVDIRDGRHTTADVTIRNR